MRTMFYLAALACGCGASPEPTSATSLVVDAGATPEDRPSEPRCRTAALSGQGALAKVHAAYCVGLAYDNTFACTFYSEFNATRCNGSGMAFSVEYAFDDTGAVVDEYGEPLGELYTSVDGAVVIEWDDGGKGRCVLTADTATLCLE